MKHLGDITKINGAAVPPVNVIIGGSPCQDLSVAGKRAGLSGERSGLFMEQLRVIKEMRQADENRGRTGKHIRPRFMVWENVPGAFSSNKGADFGAVLQETVRVVCKETPDIPMPKNGWPTAGALVGMGGDWSVAWRVLDAQFWGVPQRRRRIALVANFGGATAPEILFERDGVPGNPPQSGEQGQAPTGRTETGVGASSPAGLAYCIQGNAIGRADTAGCGGRGWREDKSYTLNTVDRPAVAVFENHSQDTRFKGPVDISQTVSSTFGMGGNNTPFVVNKETVASFKSKMGSKNAEYTVRRLTPLECERLQGFPDGWTDIGEWVDSNGKKHKDSDSPRYKALGNSIAIPPWLYVLSKLSLCCGEDHTMASLFDGIGGFPYIWEILHGKGFCLWASEIEEFPIAVTKIRFPEE